MIINIPPEITREYLRTHNVSDEDIFTYYGVSVVSGSFRSPLRDERTPSCNFYRNLSGKLFYKDWGEPDHHFDAIDLVMFKFNINFPSALKRIAKDFGLIQRSGVEIEENEQERPILPQPDEIQKEPPRIRVKTRPWETRDYRFWGQWNFSQHTLDFFCVKPLRQAWLNGNTCFLDQPGGKPAYAYSLSNSSYRYKLYFPYSKSRRFLHSHGDILQGESQLAQSLKNGVFTNDFLVITKSLKDVMKLYDFRIPAVAPMGETTPLSEQTFARISRHFGQLFSLYDLDNAGIKGMKRMRDEFNITPLWIPRFYKSKDFTDIYADYGSSEAFKLVQQFKKLHYGK